MYECFSRLKILLVDDDPFQLSMLEQQIGRYGHNVVTASEAAAAMNLVSEAYNRLNPFDLALVDYIMPEMNGIDLSCKLKSFDPLLLVVSITGDNSLETRMDLIHNPFFDGFINKFAELGCLEHYLDVAMSHKKRKLSGEKSLYKEALRKLSSQK